MVEVLNVVCDFRHLNINNTTTTTIKGITISNKYMSTVNTRKKGYNDNNETYLFK